MSKTRLSKIDMMESDKTIIDVSILVLSTVGTATITEIGRAHV